MLKRSKFLIILGALLILSSVFLLVSSHFIKQKADQKVSSIMSVVNKIMPQKSQGAINEYSNTEMPVLEIENEDIVATIEIPDYNVKLPIANDKTKFSPYRISGSVYDGTLSVFGSEKTGQFDCLSKIENGTKIKISDMQGIEFSFSVDKVYRSKTAENKAFVSDYNDLILVTKEKNSLDYIIVFCVAN